MPPMPTATVVVRIRSRPLLLIATLEDLVESLVSNDPPSHGLPDVALESFSVGP